MDLPDCLTRTSADLNGKKYSYLVAYPTSLPPKATIFLIHGLIDWSLGWRFQIPHLVNLGYLVVAPDMAGCGCSSAPTDLEEYSVNSLANDVKTLAEYILGSLENGGDDKVILGGHGAGCSVVWETCLCYPNLVKAAFSIVSPFIDSTKDQNDSSGQFQHWENQLQLNYTELEENIRDPQRLSQFVHALYGATTPSGKYAVSLERGVDLDVLSSLGKSPILSEAEADYFTQILLLREHTERGPPLRGMLNWHRAGRINHDEEWGIHRATTQLQIPALLITARMGGAILSSLAEEIEKRFSHVEMVRVDCHAFVLRQASEQVNNHISGWLRDQIGI